ncbi:MAG: hypothetical protein WED07_14290 [Candidatus Freyarchaeum deiterrae]
MKLTVTQRRPAVVPIQKVSAEVKKIHEIYLKHWLNEALQLEIKLDSSLKFVFEISEATNIPKSSITMLKGGLPFLSTETEGSFESKKFETQSIIDKSVFCVSKFEDRIKGKKTEVEVGELIIRTTPVDYKRQIIIENKNGYDIFLKLVITETPDLKITEISPGPKTQEAADYIYELTILGNGKSKILMTLHTQEEERIKKEPKTKEK